MRAVVFFVYLCFLLLSGNHHIQAGAYYNGVRYAKLIEKDRRIKGTPVHRHYSVLKDINTDQDQEHIIACNSEDDDSNNFLVKKYKLQPGHYQAYPRHTRSILNYLHHCYKAPPLFYSRASDKYITQRVLRL